MLKCNHPVNPADGGLCKKTCGARKYEWCPWCNGQDGFDWLRKNGYRSEFAHCGAISGFVLLYGPHKAFWGK